MLALLEAETTEVTERAGMFALPVRAHVVRAVFDHEDAMLIANRPNLIEFGA